MSDQTDTSATSTLFHFSLHLWLNTRPKHVEAVLQRHKVLPMATIDRVEEQEKKGKKLTTLDLSISEVQGTPGDALYFMLSFCRRIAIRWTICIEEYSAGRVEIQGHATKSNGCIQPLELARFEVRNF